MKQFQRHEYSFNDMVNIGKYSDVVMIYSSWGATSQLTIDPDTNCGNCFQITLDNGGNASDIDNEINSRRNVIQWIKILRMITMICYIGNLMIDINAIQKKN